MATTTSPTQNLSGPSAQQASRRRIAVIAMCWFLVFLDGVDTFIYGAVLPDMIGNGHLGLTDATAGAIGSYTTFGMLIGTILSGTVSNWIGRKPTVLTSIAIFALATLGCGLSVTATMFGFCRLACGFGLGALLPIAISYGMEFTTGARKAMATGIIMTAHQTGGVVAPLLALGLIESFGWQSVFIVAAAPALLLLPLAIKFLPEPPATLVTLGRRVEADAVSARFGLDPAQPRPVGASRTESLKALFRGRQWAITLLFWLTSFFGLMLVYGVGQWLPKIMGDLGYETGDSLVFSSVLNVGGVIGMLVAGRLADRFGARRIVVIWFGLTAVFVYLMGVPLPLLAVYAIVFFAGLLLFSGQTMVYATVGTHHTDADRATALGWVSGMGRFGAVFGPMAGGLLLSAGRADLGFVMFAAAALLGMVMMALAGPLIARKSATT